LDEDQIGELCRQHTLYTMKIFDAGAAEFGAKRMALNLFPPGRQAATRDEAPPRQGVKG
jgi:hypothetical protein